MFLLWNPENAMSVIKWIFNFREWAWEFNRVYVLWSLCITIWCLPKRTSEVLSIWHFDDFESLYLNTVLNGKKKIAGGVSHLVIKVGDRDGLEDFRWLF